MGRLCHDDRNATWKTVRVFISSALRQMQPERDREERMKAEV